jgi:hypothetical protein
MTQAQRRDADRIKAGEMFRRAGLDQTYIAIQDTTWPQPGKNVEVLTRTGTVYLDRHERVEVLTEPKVGMGATLYYPDDRYGYVVTRVSPSGKTITVRALETPNRDTPNVRFDMSNPFGIVSLQYSDSQRETMQTGDHRSAHLRKDGCYYLSDSPLILGSAVYYRNNAL